MLPQMDAGGSELAAVIALLDDLARLERRTEDLAVRMDPRDSQLAATVDALRTSAQRRREAIERQRRDRGATTAAAPAAPISELRALYAALAETLVGYAELHATAHRAFDSLREGSTADLAEAHLRECAAAIQQLDLLVSDVVVAALSEAGGECQCQCPACALGICLCSPHGAITVRDAWRSGVPEPPAGGVRVRRPRSGSPADRAGLREGDVVVAIDGAAITHDLDAPAVQRAIGARASGEEIRLQVKRSGAGPIDVSARRP